MHPQAAIHQASLLSVNESTAEAFWLNAAKDLQWHRPPTKAWGPDPHSSDKQNTWFPDGEMNTCYNAVDRHVEAGHGNRVAFRCISVMNPNLPYRAVTYKELLEEVQILAGVLQHTFGVKKGDRAIIYMPMIFETAVAMLACARIGAIHSVVFGGFAPKELAKRIDDAKPAILIAASCGLEPGRVVDYREMVNTAIGHSQQANSLKVLMYQREGINGHKAPSTMQKKSEFSWTEQCAEIRQAKKARTSCTAVPSSFPLYILYTSGTTGSPKGVQRASGGHAVASRYSIEHTFGLNRDSTIFCASDFGWVVGHSYILYCPLLIGCTSIIFEGKPVVPDAGIFWRIIQDYNVNVLFTAPTALRAVRRADANAEIMSRYNLRSLGGLFLAGERSEPGIIVHYQEILSRLAAPGAVVNDNWWSTESGSPISACALNRSFAYAKPQPGAAGMLLPGMDVRIVDDDGKEVVRGETGNIVIGTPLPPSALSTVWGNPKRFHEAYFERFANSGGWFDTGDAGLLSEEGYICVLSRADDLINVAGHRLGTSLLEQVVAAHPHVAECCVVGLPDELKGHVPFALVTLAAGDEARQTDLASLLKSVNMQLAEDVGRIAVLGGLATSRLPKTRSGKTLRRTVKVLLENAAVGKWDADAPYPPTIEDAAVVDEVRKSVNDWTKSQKHRAKAKL